MARIPLRPVHPDRVCWGCDLYCPADDLGCGNGTIRTPHPCALFGDDWLECSLKRQAAAGGGLAPGLLPPGLPYGVTMRCGE